MSRHQIGASAQQADDAEQALAANKNGVARQ